MNKFRKFNELTDYLKFIGCKGSYEYVNFRCEVCNSDKFQTVLTHTDCGSETLVPLPVSACKECGFLMQNPRLSGDFYDRFYKEFYPKLRALSQSNVEGDPNNVGGKMQMNNDGSANEHGFNVAKERAKNLYNYLEKKRYISKKGNLLDVGCGCGGFLDFFKELGWEVKGNDPDETCAKTAIDKNLPVELIPGEKMQEDKEKYDLVIIIGSLEHCQDPNEVLKRCWESMKDGAIIVIEGRYFPISESFRWLNANHQRFFVHESSQSILIKHGFEILESTTYPVCGGSTGRNGGGFAFAKKASLKDIYNMDIAYSRKQFLEKLQKKQLLDSPENIIEKIKKHDSKFIIHEKYMV